MILPCTHMAWRLRREGFRRAGKDRTRSGFSARHYYDRGSVRVILDTMPMRRTVTVSRECGDRWYAILSDPPERVVFDLIKLARRNL